MAFTYFFRDKQTLDMVNKYTIPELKNKQYIKIWDAGCAMGPEPYSLAIILRENVGSSTFKKVTIYATDIDNCDLFGDIIKKGIYPEDQIKRIPEDIKDKYFFSNGEPGHFIISEEIRKSIEYKKHDLLSLQPVGKNFGLVVCKNVLLHFSPNERIDVIKMYYDVLDDGGFLVMEHTQKLPEQFNNMFQQVITSAQLFRKVKPV